MKAEVDQGAMSMQGSLGLLLGSKVCIVMTNGVHLWVLFFKSSIETQPEQGQRRHHKQCVLSPAAVQKKKIFTSLVSQQG